VIASGFQNEIASQLERIEEAPKVYKFASAGSSARLGADAGAVISASRCRRAPDAKDRATRAQTWDDATAHAFLDHEAPRAPRNELMAPI